ncbi:hypothetical protein EK21DRAFT_90626 [Setomelanomma holmii]|uniref:Uncharacterized protein n=1 Tax=Setomelanomma holmii TaxID=210430 RepID=A0A9P4H5D3_9PLEO|nr:hypothetical protein EK21DRAFT_90626 [Setomelanomma holmii]
MYNSRDCKNMTCLGLSMSAMHPLNGTTGIQSYMLHPRYTASQSWFSSPNSRPVATGPIKTPELFSSDYRAQANMLPLPIPNYYQGHRVNSSIPDVSIPQSLSHGPSPFAAGSGYQYPHWPYAYQLPIRSQFPPNYYQPSLRTMKSTIHPIEDGRLAAETRLATAEQKGHQDDIKKKRLKKEDLERMIAEMEEAELKHEEEEKRYNEERKRKVEEDKARATERIKEQDERLRWLEREADEAEARKEAEKQAKLKSEREARQSIVRPTSG